MQAWLRISMLLWIFGFFRELRPSEPFVTEYLSGHWRNITAEEVNKDIYPFGTYAVLAQLAIIFLITDILRYKPVILVSACAGIILFAFLLWAQQVWELKIGQIFYGTFTASEVAYYTYIYAKVDKERYQIVTAHTRSAILCGRFLAGVLGQVFVSTDILDYRGLHYFSFGTQIISLFIALILPSVGKSLYFYSTTEQELELKDAKTTTDLPPIVSNITGNTIHVPSDMSLTPNKPKFSWRNAYRLLIKHIVSAYTNPTVIRWSFWWALATCVQMQLLSYIQFLWKEIDGHNHSYYNGGVEAINTLFGAGSAMLAGVANTSHHKNWHMWIIVMCSLFMGTFIIISAITYLVWVAYTMYILFNICYFFVITTASAIVAGNLSEDSFGLIFGINQLVALILQTILTLIVVTDTGYGLGTRAQFMVYGSYFIVLAILYFIAVFFHIIHKNLNCCNYARKDIEI